MGSKEELAASDPGGEATAMEMWASGELGDEAGAAGGLLVFGGMTAVLVALAVMFIALAPGV